MKRNRLLLLGLLFLTVGVILFSLAIQHYRVLTKSQAAGETIPITFSSTKTFGQIDQSVGVIVGNISAEGVVADLQKYFKGKGVYLKLINPTVETINSPAFTTLQQDGFNWYLSFDTYEKIDTAVAAYYAKYQSDIVVELTNAEIFDPTKTQTLKTTYPNVTFHAGGFVFWPRDKVKTLVTNGPPNLVGAYTFTLETADGTLWDYMKLMYATVFDASMDIPGNSGITINYPQNASLSLSHIRIPGSQIQNQIRRYSNVVSAVVSTISSQAAVNKAPIRFIMAGEFEQLNGADKSLLSTFASTLQLKPAVVWPEAIAANGDPWDTTKPIAGYMSFKNDKWYGMLFNTEAIETTIQLPNIDYTGYKTYSNIRAITSIITTSKQIVMQPYEIIAIVPESVIIPTGSDIAPLSGVLECDSGPDPYNSNRIVIKNGTNQAIDKIELDLFRCTYIPGKLEQFRGSYRCEGGAQACADNAASCFTGTWDEAFSQPKRNIVLQPGESMTYEYEKTACATAQMDVRTMNDGIAAIECHNVQSSNTVKPGEMWPGGYAFAISENAQGYDTNTQSCPQATPTATPVPPTATVVPPTATVVPSTATVVPSTVTVVPPMVTHTPVPPTATAVPPTATPTQVVVVVTNTPVPVTPSPVTNLAVEGQSPGFNPLFVLLIPFGLILLGLAL